ncbi:2-keto-4-pentenoate hydratase [Glaciecola punicea ACAM 611]|uniref:2-keto-4-pentenoate hydratase n=1 Tax=Glaciecola punicea ACAM 611 TaxID=1121923 RepID=H5TC11_9ALTE|nr:fumarylacetoacetate hydrolase family protein [Glaciecola punicea]OFA29819.1 2-keto-4-pentenoate hydratase [Glaciecola punicea]GAB55838.1 2-keto-4-pentenoate hydratase [Glaciecola punicea ACAM 611]
MKHLKLATTAAVVIAAGFWLMQPEDPERTNPFDGEAQPLSTGILSPQKGLTLALERITPDGAPHVLLVTELQGDQISAVDLTAAGLTTKTDFFDVLTDVGIETLVNIAQADANDQFPVVQRSFGDLLPAAGTAARHVASGTNFPEHQEETGSESVFNFPKFGVATPPVTTVSTDADELLDYEVEICTRFDRDIERIEDFDAAQKGFFLCGDFSNRSVLTRLIDPDNFDSGTGFSDAKSGPERFPSGGLFVVPLDWESFVKNERLVTQVNDEIRQDARAGEMILSFRSLVEKALADTESTRFLYDDKQFQLVENGMIARDQVLMSGTAEGVIFMPPNMKQIVRGAMLYIVKGTFLTGQAPYDAVLENFLDEERASLRFLQPGHLVTHNSSNMGTISVVVQRAEN